MFARWLPDGQSLLVYFSYRKLGRVDVETGDVTRILPEFRFPEPGVSGPYRTFMDLAPDGRSLYYAANGADAATAAIKRVGLETGVVADVAQARANKVHGIAVSPDGGQVAFTVQDGDEVRGRHATVLVAPTSGGAPRVLYGADGIALRDVVWSQDGQRLFFTSSVNRFDGPKTTEVGADIWTVRIDGADARPLGIGLNDEYYLTMHPNGRQLIFMDENYRNELWIMRNLFPAPSAGR